ncbi:MAG: hypothetical protein QXI98_02550 [Candidatus Bathyarchaeia archaeon]
MTIVKFYASWHSFFKYMCKTILILIFNYIEPIVSIVFKHINVINGIPTYLEYRSVAMRKSIVYTVRYIASHISHIITSL